MRVPLAEPWQAYVGLERLSTYRDASDAEAIVWLDIDNTLYSHMETRIADRMVERIRAYFLALGMSEREADELHMHYYKEYGLAIRGLVRHHTIDPMDYDQKCDASLPLESLLRPDEDVIRMLQRLDRTRTRVYALTNAYKFHAERVLRLLHLDTLVEGVVYCDYTNPDFLCKPYAEFYLAAEAAVQAPHGAHHYFVDDSRTNVDAARRLGWEHCVHFDETCTDASARDVPTIAHLRELERVWPSLFRSTST
ncbi:hypothetical protein MCAP1_001982 [Malassezia caprae]|uniref:Pyrimidine 5-nucleotidase n=1 Tax=Malassezia caprae TaxID=1381934 RepID=A0AAF0IVJ6_9BASI|nr:hypothetical protein MCAP1_001982 [Malassezia caprae]